jgi:hypothetical protein
MRRRTPELVTVKRSIRSLSFYLEGVIETLGAALSLHQSLTLVPRELQPGARSVPLASA